MRTRMKRIDAAASFSLALSLIALTGCGDLPWTVDPFGINGRLQLDPYGTNSREGGGPVSYSSSMRIADAAYAGSDFATALNIYRRASAMDTDAVAPFVGAGNSLLAMGKYSEAIVSFNSGLARDAHDRDALRGAARAYLMSGRPALAGQPLAIAYNDTPDDPKLLQLIGVADDFVGRHEEAQTRYRRGLELSPQDPALSLDLALSLALTGDYPDAVNILRPIATAPTSSRRERQTLALIYGLQGDRRAAENIARQDLDPASVQRNLAYYESLRRLSPEARHRAIQSLGVQEQPGQPS